MPKSIFEVEIDDRAFDRFKKLFDAYDKALKTTPKAWRNVNAEIDKATTGILDTRDELVKTREGVNKVTQATDAWRRMTGATDVLVGSIENRFSRIARRSKEIVLSVARFTTWTGIASGLLGAGSLWGLERIASRAGNIRRVQQGLGVGEGAVQAFQTNFQRFFDPRSVLENIASAKNDPSQQWAFSTMGLDYRRKTEDLAVEMPLRAKRIFAEGGQNIQYAQARGLTNFYSPEDLRRLHEMSEEEIRSAQRRYQMDLRQFRVSDDMLKKWQLLSVQLERSATVIESSFIRALSPLAPELEKLSDAFTKAVSDIFTTERLREVITYVSEGIEAAGKYLASEKFKEDLKEFGDSIERLWNAVSRVARWIGGLFGGSSTAAVSVPGNPINPGVVNTGGIGSAWWHGNVERQIADLGAFYIHRRADRSAIGSLGSVPGVDVRSGIDPGSWDLRGGSRVGAWESLGRGGTPFADVEARHRLPQGLLDRIWRQESSRGANLGPSSAGALGHFQFMPATGAQYGLQREDRPGGRNDFNDLARSSEAAGRYMSDLVTMFQGDLRAAVAAYNWGPRRVSEAQASRGERWEELLPSETSRYLAQVLGPRAPSQIQIRVDNQTGGSAVVTQNVTVAQ
jgi:hypothetical protein